MKILSDYAVQNKLDNFEVLKWIVVKTLRLTINQFEKIKRINEEQLNSIKDYILKYKNGESLGKIFGFIEFYGNMFDVTENVFDPRLSSETLVDVIMATDKNFLKKAQIIDLCTGSGCIAITLSKLLKKEVDAVDISPFAIEIAQQNMQKNNAKVNFLKFDLNDDWNMIMNKSYDIIVSNPPYWNANKILCNEEVVRNNPLIGFDGGDDGLKYIKLIICNAKEFLNKNGYLILEVDFDQIDVVKEIMISNGFYNIKKVKDHKGIDRVLSCQKK